MRKDEEFFPASLGPLDLPFYQSKEEFSRAEVLWMLGYLIKNPSPIENAIHLNGFNSEELLMLAESTIPKLSQKKQLSQFEFFGKYYGYPSCCIKWFENYSQSQQRALTPEQENAHNNDGFIPCPSCSEKVQLGMPIRYLIENRLHPQPYPKS